MAIAFMAGCQILPPGENNLIKEVYNPKQNLKAVIFEKIGNATVDNSIQVLIESYGYKLKDTDNGNVFIAGQIGGIKGADNEILNVNWSNDSLLIIGFPNSVSVFKKELSYESSVTKVVIDYQSN